MKKKVLHIINSLQPGGAEILLINSLSPGGLSEHTENHLAYFTGRSYLAEKLDKTVKVHDLAYGGVKDIPALIKRIRHIIVENDIDIVHTHLNPAGVYTHFACRGKVPHLHTMHTTYSMDRETSPMRKWVEKRFYLLKKNINLALLSEFARQDLLKTIPFRGKTFVLNNFIADAFFDCPHQPYSAQGSSLKIVAAGTLKPLKNFEYLLDVFEHLRGYNITLDIYGQGDRSKYETVIRQKELKINMKGAVPAMEKLLGDYDLFIMPSLFEGVPLTALEAMAAGVPVMLSDIAPLKNYMKDHAMYFGLDDSKATAGKILSVFNGQTDISKFAAGAKEFAENCARRSAYINNLLGIYESIAGNE